MTQEGFEKKVINKMLEGKHKAFPQLVMQFADAKIISREFTGKGFLTEFDVPDGKRFNNLSGRIDDVVAYFDKSKRMCAFILYVENGKISALEGYTFEEKWPAHYNEVKLEYAYDERKLRFDDSALNVVGKL